jgi:acetoin utilization protein AcuB
MEFNDAKLDATSKMEFTDPVSTVMTKSVVVANQFHNFSSVLELFSKHGMHHLPIVDGSNKIVGIVSSNDLLKLFLDSKYKNLSLNTDEADKAINIADIMTKNPITITPKETIKTAAKLFADYGFGILPVVENGEIVGILSIKDIVHGIAYFS